MKTIEIKSIYGDVLFTHTCESNTILITLLVAIKSNADLSCANLSNAYLSNANLSSADLSVANLSGANLSNADLIGANLRGADLSDANLSNADLSVANLSNANLRGTNLNNANLSGIKFNENTAFITTQCPDEGSFIAWKKAAGNMIVKLRVTENAKRSSATTLKCRCSEAEVLDIQDVDGNSLDISAISSKHNSSFVYTKGEVVRVENFDENRWNECSTGIHFFTDRIMAVNYN